MRPVNSKTIQFEYERAAMEQATMADPDPMRWPNSSPQNLNVHLLFTCSELPDKRHAR
jgi:hypothetical protein